jgi:type II secretory pathway component PulJ
MDGWMDRCMYVVRMQVAIDPEEAVSRTLQALEVDAVALGSPPTAVTLARHNSGGRACQVSDQKRSFAAAVQERRSVPGRGTRRAHGQYSRSAVPPPAGRNLTHGAC